ncbi:MAG: hypothetical protein CL608_25865 [Anaerolineaceae bacterium]|nr:hypothetical protein [Anaerolineaceae bacterium]
MEKKWLRLILLLYGIIGLTYALVTPVFEASDELWHYPMIRHLADGNRLPVQVFDPALAGPWKQQASQPPLYYYLGAALTFWIDASDMEQVRWENPHVDNGLITVDGNINLTVHDPDWSPWQGTLLAVRLVRVFSLFLGLATVYMTNLIAREVVPDRPEIALGATAATAFLPMFLFISGAVNNDNLIIPLAALTLFLLIRVVGGGQPMAAAWQWIEDNRQTWLLIGVVVGLAALTKISGVGLLPLVWSTAVMAAWRESDRQVTLSNCLRWLAAGTGRWLLALLPVLLIAGWWYGRNMILYDDWRGWSAFISVLGQRAQPATLAQLWGERRGFMMSFWGLFGGVNVPMAMWVYAALNTAVIIAAGGFVIHVATSVREWYATGEWRFMRRAPITALLDIIQRHFPLIVCLLWVSAVIYGLIDWTTTTWSSQGRLVFSALPALQILFVMGLARWLPLRFSRLLVGLLAGFLAIIAFLAPWVWIRPAYQPERYAPPQTAATTPTHADFGNGLRLTGYAATGPQTDNTAVMPGDFVDVILTWELLAPIAHNWSVFVHLNDPVIGVPIAQRDMYHGQGLQPTSLLKPGQELTTFYRLQVPETAVSPTELKLTVGLYDFGTGERIALDNGQDTFMLAQLPLAADPGQYPNALSINFHNEFELVGYSPSSRQIQPGEAIDLTLYVRPLRSLTTDYTFFAQILGDDATRWAGVDLPLPTSQWAEGEIQAITLPLLLADETPGGIYPLILGMYTRPHDNGFQRLHLVAKDGRITQDDFLPLTLVGVSQSP